MVSCRLCLRRMNGLQFITIQSNDSISVTATTVPQDGRCAWPKCNNDALCRSGNFGDQLVCEEHFRITNGSAAVNSADTLSVEAVDAAPAPQSPTEARDRIEALMRVWGLASVTITGDGLDVTTVRATPPLRDGRCPSCVEMGRDCGSETSAEYSNRAGVPLVSEVERLYTPHLNIGHAFGDDPSAPHYAFASVVLHSTAMELPHAFYMDRDEAAALRDKLTEMLDDERPTPGPVEDEPTSDTPTPIGAQGDENGELLGIVSRVGLRNVMEMLANEFPAFAKELRTISGDAEYHAAQLVGRQSRGEMLTAADTLSDAAFLDECAMRLAVSIFEDHPISEIAPNPDGARGTLSKSAYDSADAMLAERKRRRG